jgi:heavy metal sensor kinase
VKSLPIGARLTAWYSLMLAVSLCLFGGVAYLSMSHSIRATVDEELQQRLQAVREIINDNATAGVPVLQDEFRELMKSEGEGARLRVAYHDGPIIYASPGMQKETQPASAQTAARQFHALIQGARFSLLDQTVELKGVQYDVEVAASTQVFDRSLDRFRRLLYGAGPFFLILVALGGYWLSRRALVPVDQIIHAARSIGARDLSRRLRVSRTGDELERLADTLNEMLSRLEAAFQRVTQFTADASHELRTPISLMRTNAEIMLRKPRSDAEYREALSGILDESERASRLIEQLLLLARADSGTAVLQARRTDLNAAMQSACREASMLAEAKELQFGWSVPDNPLKVWGDSTSLERLFVILLDNAVKYTARGGQVDVRLQSDDGFAVADVRDTGTGIPADDIGRVFDRFYRADHARSRESGGTGLGLAIARWIAEAHGGEIRVESELGTGSTFKVRIPLSRNEPGRESLSNPGSA